MLPCRLGRSTLQLLALLFVASPLVASPLFASPLAAVPKEGGNEIESCKETVLENPEDRAGFECFTLLARSRGNAGEAEAALRELLQRFPDSGWGRVELARVIWSTKSPEIGSLLEKASEQLSKRDLALEAARVDLLLARFWAWTGEIDAASRRIDAVETLARGKDRSLLASAHLAEARLLWNSGRDFGLALDRLEEIDRSQLEPSDELGYWTLLATLRKELGRIQPSLAAWRAAIDAAESRGEVSRLPLYWLNFALVQIASDDPATASAALASLQAGLDRAHSLSETPPSIVARLHLLYGKMSRGAQRNDHLRRAFELARQIGDDNLQSMAVAASAVRTLDEDPGRARLEIEKAVALAPAPGRTGTPWPIRYLLGDRSTVDWATLPPEQAVIEEERVLDYLEDLRHLQDPEVGRSGWSSVWVDAYRRLAGRLLEQSTDAASIGRAVSTLERMRARSLLDSLAASGAIEAESEPGEALVALRENLQRQLEVQRAARLRSTPPELAALETEEVDLWRAVRDESPAWASLYAPEVPSIEEIQAALGPSEAAVIFQLAPWKTIYGDFAGGSWATVVEHDAARAHRIEDPQALDAAISTFDRLPDPDGATAALERLGAWVLGKATAELSADVERLVVVADGAIHRLPLERLRVATRETGPGPVTTRLAPLGDRFALSYVPSLTLWARWRSRPPAPRPASVFAVGDPPIRGDVDALDDSRLDPVTARWLRANQSVLAPLPWARREIDALAERVPTTALVGDAATEEAVRRAPLSSHGVLHFAAHAVADRDSPARSAVVLGAASPYDSTREAPLDGASDGLLRPTEIAALALDGALVTLSTCDSATGQVLRGEGALSLARPFFQAGARAVVASLRPVGDRAAAAFVDRFYRELARGARVDDALASADRALRRLSADGVSPPSFIVLGDGGYRPFPDGVERTSPRRRAGWAVLALGLMAALASAFAARRARGPRATGELRAGEFEGHGL